VPAKSLYRKENAALASLIREMRIAADLTQVACAEALGRPQSFVSNVESGERRLDLLQLREYCAVCGISLSTFVKRFEASL
jgi:transcriptional regulator with XRE-family HTH domain